MNQVIYYSEYSSPLGQIILSTTEQGLCGIYFHDQRYFSGTQQWQKAAHPHLEQAIKQLDEYFQGQRQTFDLQLDLSVSGTAFQRAVWNELLSIPFGQISSYQMQANRIHKPRAVRAVGGAIGRNPISIVIPCHRVLSSDRALTGYAGGLERKKYLLELEGTRVTVVA